MRLSILLLLALLPWGSWAAQPPIVLTTQELPPYSFTNPAGKPDGIATRRVECALNRLKRAYQIKVEPWARAQKEVETGSADAFFAASHSDERDVYAVLSQFIAPQEWRWYVLADSKLDPASADFRDHAKVGSYIGANMLDWLKDNSYRVYGEPATPEQLLRMLLAKRLDALLANNLSMQVLLEKSGKTQAVRSILLQDKPLGVYFSKRFPATQPADFMRNFNRAVLACPLEIGADSAG